MSIVATARKLASKPLKLANNMRFIGAYLNLANKGTTDAADKLERAMSAFATAEDTKKLTETMTKLPALKEMFDNWYIPPTYTLDDLKQYKPGTFGYAYYHHMTDNGLGIDYYPVPAASDALGYFRMRSVQTHDMWHVLMGMPPVPSGEHGALYFMLGHYARHLDELAVPMMQFISFIVSAGIFQTASQLGDKLIESFQRESQGWEIGYNAKPLFAGQWESWWDKPLAELREQYNIKAATTIYDYAPAEEEKELAGVS